MRNPCLGCKLLRADKDNKACAGCELRVEYLRWLDRDTCGLPGDYAGAPARCRNINFHRPTSARDAVALPDPDRLREVLDDVCRRHGVTYEVLTAGYTGKKNLQIVNARRDAVVTMHDELRMTHYQSAAVLHLARGSISAYVQRARKAAMLPEDTRSNGLASAPKDVTRVVAEICRRCGVTMDDVCMCRRSTRNVARVRMLITAALRAAPYRMSPREVGALLGVGVGCVAEYTRCAREEGVLKLETGNLKLEGLQ